MNRGKLFKLLGVLLVAMAFLSLGCGASSAPQIGGNPEGGSVKVEKGKKVLVAYYSWGGNTKALAEEIHRQVGGDLLPILPEEAYPSSYNATVDRAKAEQTNNARPAVKTKIANFDQYDVVLLGYPNWWGSAPMFMATFAESYKWDGKVIAPFFTHGGGGVQRCYSDMQKYAKGAQFADYLCISGSSARNAQGDVTAWLQKIGLK